MAVRGDANTQTAHAHDPAQQTTKTEFGIVDKDSLGVSALSSQPAGWSCWSVDKMLSRYVPRGTDFATSLRQRSTLSAYVCGAYQRQLTGMRDRKHYLVDSVSTFSGPVNGCLEPVSLLTCYLNRNFSTLAWAALAGNRNR